MALGVQKQLPDFLGFIPIWSFLDSRIKANNFLNFLLLISDCHLLLHLLNRFIILNVLLQNLPTLHKFDH